eukprot:CAMPEP_0183294690 /NCGR_PEP_ID=MMETSP0160_2-20130417/2923_1 /TAXON_ID=2839 ORGANISM="Odontella Sinensis, Strain Grunow 1884" /NCGR_SAMPLE_ID=MMETSP0160_2 /ASSEMBLY_ACC=CAM_ASM_000250 /LENGTH=256 /DNA_ID=CAMNT_0025456049 /DNA_START=54 /DNA_END=824 /DNA_ORIENTATION=-
MIPRLLPLMLLTAYVAAKDEDSQGFDGIPDLGRKNCPKFKCSGGYTPVQKLRPKFESSGCNSMGSGMVYSGMSNSELPSAPCCDQWHACYQVCGSTKRLCDESFKKCADKACAEVADEKIRKDCEQQVSVSSMMLGFDDCRKFDSAQLAACQCVESSSVKRQRKDVIKGFYKKYVPGGLDESKIASLAEKADQNSKMAGLLLKLLTKYPKAIKQVKDPQQAKMEEMMKRAKEVPKPREKEEEVEELFDDSEETQEL